MTTMSKNFYRASAEDFGKIPGSPIAYWVSEKSLLAFSNNTVIEKYAQPMQGSTIGDNERFLRYWFELTHPLSYTWKDTVKGGAFRLWFGNELFVVNWGDNGEEIRSTGKATIRNAGFLFKKGIEWSRISTNTPAFRILEEGRFQESASGIAFPEEDKVLNILGLMNSNSSVYFLSVINPTLTFQSGDVSRIPYVGIDVSVNVQILISISKKDWNSIEYSKYFEFLPLLSMGSNDENITANHYPLTTKLSNAYTTLRSQWADATMQMQRLEEENNRIFIDAYGLQDELTPEVPLNEITLTCNPHYRYGGDKTEEQLEGLLLQDTIKEFISYAVGCMFGRYSLDKPGLILANAGETLGDYLEKVASYQWRVASGNTVDSDEWRVASEEKEGENDGQKLQGSAGLAEGDGNGNGSVSSNTSISENRTVQPNQSNSESVCVGSFEHSGGAGSEFDKGVSAFSGNSERVVSRSGNATADSSKSRLYNSTDSATNTSNSGRSESNAQRPDEITKLNLLATNHSPLVTFMPDDDNVIPIMDVDWFGDDIAVQFNEFLKRTFGEENFEENLRFVEDALGYKTTGKGKRQSIRDYFLKDFYIDHWKRYKKRPIYWMFSSPKGTFNALIYMHRYRPDTVSTVLNEYLREFSQKLTAHRDNKKQESLTAEGKLKIALEKEITTLGKQIEELADYERDLFELASKSREELTIDLDDGVKVNYPKFAGVLKKIAGLS